MPILGHMERVFQALASTPRRKILAYLAEMFSDRIFCQQLRETDSDQALFERLRDWRPAAMPPP